MLDICRKAVLSCRFWLCSPLRPNPENPCETPNTTKKCPRLPVLLSDCRGHLSFHIFLFDIHSTFEVYFHAIRPDDDRFDERFHHLSVPVVGGVAFLHVLPEVCQPHPHCGIPGVRCLECLLPVFQCCELLAVVVYLRVVVRIVDGLRPFLSVQGEYLLLQVYDFLLHFVQCGFVARLQLFLCR